MYTVRSYLGQVWRVQLEHLRQLGIMALTSGSAIFLYKHCRVNSECESNWILGLVQYKTSESSVYGV